MPFRCPQCLTRDSLEITVTFQLPPDNRSDDIALQIVECSACKFQGIAVYEESRRGRMDSESWEHIGYWVSPDAVESVRQAIATCPEPFNGRCSCTAHTSLSKTDVRGVWKGLVEMERGHTFLMRMAL